MSDPEFVTGDKLEAGDTIYFARFSGEYRITALRPFQELSAADDAPFRTAKLYGLYGGRRVERWVVLDTRELYKRVVKGENHETI